MKEKLLQFLKALEVAIVPPPGCHHSITYNTYGADGESRDELGLHIWVADSHRIFFLDDGDFDKPTEDLVAEIVELASA